MSECFFVDHECDDDDNVSLADLEPNGEDGDVLSYENSISTQNKSKRDKDSRTNESKSSRNIADSQTRGSLAEIGRVNVRYGLNNFIFLNTF